MHVLFLGLGSIGTRHLRLLQEVDPTVEVSAYRSGATENDPDIEDVTVYRDLDSALAGSPDVAFITNPTHLHVEYAIACAEADCHLFIEKPLSHTTDRVDDLVSTVDRRGLVTVMGCQLRYHPVLTTTNQLLDDEFGPVYSFRVESGSPLPEWRPDRDYREMYSAKKDMGGGVVLDLIHELDYTHWLFGGVDVAAASTGRVSDLDIETEDVAEIVLETNPGAIGSVHLDYFRPQPKRTFEIVGSEGILVGDLLSGTLERRGSGENRRWSFDVDRDDLHRAQIEDFLAHVERGVSPENDVQEGRRVLALALEAKGKR